MDELRKGEQVWVTESSNGVDLRREPTLNSRTADGKDNVILPMPPGADVVLEGVEVRTNDGHDWYNIRYIHEAIDETGWAMGDDLSISEKSQGSFQIPVTGGAEITDIQYKGNRKFDVAYLQSDPQPITQGLVMYKIGGQTRQTSLDEWNAAAGPYYKI